MCEVHDNGEVTVHHECGAHFVGTAALGCPVPSGVRAMSQTLLRSVVLFPLLLSSCMWAQDADKAEQSTIARAKKIQVSTIDARLPKVTLEFFLHYESEGAPIHWEVNDCGEQTGNPSVNQERNFPTCVEADFDVHHRSVSVMIAVGTSNQKDRDTPGFFGGTITNSDGTSRTIQRLGDLPAQLRRFLPRQPRIVPDATHTA